MKHTKGKVRVLQIETHTFAVKTEENINAQYADRIATCTSPFNAELIAEAFNVTNECGLTPRQLLEQRNELQDLIKKTRDVCYKLKKCLQDMI